MNRAQKLAGAFSKLVETALFFLPVRKRAVVRAHLSAAFSVVWEERLPGGGGAMLFEGASPEALYRGWTAQTKEPDTNRWIDGFEAGSVLWDIGANVGVFSLYAALKGHRVVAFEPVVENYAVLSHNITLNRLDERIVAYCLALGDADDLGTIFVDYNRPGSTSQFGNRLNASQIARGAVCRRLDSLYLEGRLAKPTHIKIDVDGNEESILKGARRVLDDPHLKSVLVEVNGDAAEEARVVETLRLAGFASTRGDRYNMIFSRA
jgi:FkbM family methyltransferase